MRHPLPRPDCDVAPDTSLTPRLRCSMRVPTGTELVGKPLRVDRAANAPTVTPSQTARWSSRLRRFECQLSQSVGSKSVPLKALLFPLTDEVHDDDHNGCELCYHRNGKGFHGLPVLPSQHPSVLMDSTTP